MIPVTEKMKKKIGWEELSFLEDTYVSQSFSWSDRSDKEMELNELCLLPASRGVPECAEYKLEDKMDPNVSLRLC